LLPLYERFQPTAFGAQDRWYFEAFCAVRLGGG
jgi:hypothetical protein